LHAPRFFFAKDGAVAKQQRPKQQRFNIELPRELDPVYANFAVISHTPNEMIIDFAQLLPGMPKGKVQARVLLTPANAKMLHQALGQNVAKYERRFGEIKPVAGPAGPFDPKTGKLGGLQWTVGDDDDDNEDGG
jgi:hypothetical protein